MHVNIGSSHRIKRDGGEKIGREVRREGWRKEGSEEEEIIN